jgi:hypothetical protein
VDTGHSEQLEDMFLNVLSVMVVVVGKVAEFRQMPRRQWKVIPLVAIGLCYRAVMSDHELDHTQTVVCVLQSRVHVLELWVISLRVRDRLWSVALGGAVDRSDCVQWRHFWVLLRRSQMDSGRGSLSLPRL